MCTFVFSHKVLSTIKCIAHCGSRIVLWRMEEIENRDFMELVIPLERCKVLNKIKNSIKYFSCVRHCVQSFAGIISSNPQKPRELGAIIFHRRKSRLERLTKLSKGCLRIT